MKPLNEITEAEYQERCRVQREGFAAARAQYNCDGSLKKEEPETSTGATAGNGDEWTGGRDGEWWMYRDTNGDVYESKEVPAYRIKLNATQRMVDGKLSIVPVSAL